MRIEDGLVVFLALAIGGVLLAGLAQALDGRRHLPRSRPRPRPDARPGGAVLPVPAPATEVRPGAVPSGDEAPVSGEGAPPDAARRDRQETGGSASGAPVGSAPELAAPVGSPAGPEEAREALADDRDPMGLRRGGDEMPAVQAEPDAAVTVADDQTIAAPSPTPPVAMPEDSTPADQTIATPPTTRAATARGKSAGADAELAPAAHPVTSSRVARVAARFSPRIGGSATELTATPSVAPTPSSTASPPDPAPGTAPGASARHSTGEGADAPAGPVSAAAPVAAEEIARPRTAATRARRPEGRGAPGAGRSERGDRGWTRLSTEIDRLIGRALDGDGEVADGDASLSALSAAAEMLAAVPAEGSSPDRRRDLAGRLQSAYVELGNARRERGALEGALGPLSSAVELAVGDPERDREAREALARAVDALVDRLAENTRARIRADDLGGAMTASRRLSQVVDDALARGLSPADLAGALARRQAVMLELAEGRTV
jgi:hypothetical protein